MKLLILFIHYLYYIFKLNINVTFTVYTMIIIKLLEIKRFIYVHIITKL